MTEMMNGGTAAVELTPAAVAAVLTAPPPVSAPVVVDSTASRVRDWLVSTTGRAVEAVRGLGRR